MVQISFSRVLVWLILVFFSHHLMKAQSHALSDHQEWQTKKDQLSEAENNLQFTQKDLVKAQEKGSRKLKMVLHEAMNREVGMGRKEALHGGAYITGAKSFVNGEVNVKLKYGGKPISPPHQKFSHNIAHFVAFKDDYHGRKSTNDFENSLQAAQNHPVDVQDNFEQHVLIPQKNINTLERMTSRPLSSAMNGAARSELPDAGLHPTITSKHTQHPKSLPRSSKPSFNQEAAAGSKDHSKDETQRLLEATKQIVNLMGKDYKGSLGKPRRKPPINNRVPVH